MRVLFAGPHTSPVFDYLVTHEDGVHRIEGKIIHPDADMIVSHGYREIVSPEVLAETPAVNLHIGYLPWNRGASPNFWSVYEGTPGGVTIHWMDEGLDTGPIIAQRWVAPSGTLRTSYDRLQCEIVDLFKEWWPAIRLGVPGRPQTEPAGYCSGSEHKTADLPDVDWDDPVEQWLGSGLEGAKRLCR